jgi:transglutaminase-like putative cysteine protease
VKYRVRHRSRYSYARQVQLSYHALHLRPRQTAHQHVLRASISTDPAPATLSEGADYFGNGLDLLTVTEPHLRLTVDLDAVVDVAFPPPPDATPGWERVRDLLRAARGPELSAAAEFTYPSALATADEAIARYAAASFAPGREVLDGARELTARIHRDFAFDPEATSISTPLAETMRMRRGVCQDFAQIQIAGLRSLGLAARYVSGYIRNDRGAAPVPAWLDGRDASPEAGVQGGLPFAGTAFAGVAFAGAAGDAGLGTAVPPVAGSADDAHCEFVGADASHAWVSVYCPGSGWIDLDPTNDLLVRQSHVVLAWGRDYRDVSPISGILVGGGEHALDVEVAVQALS